MMEDEQEIYTIIRSTNQFELALIATYNLVLLGAIIVVLEFIKVVRS